MEDQCADFGGGVTPVPPTPTQEASPTATATTPPGNGPYRITLPLIWRR